MNCDDLKPWDDPVVVRSKERWSLGRSGVIADRSVALVRSNTEKASMDEFASKRKKDDADNVDAVAEAGITKIQGNGE